MRGMWTKRSTTIPSVLRGTSFDIYFPSTGTGKKILMRCCFQPISCLLPLFWSEILNPWLDKRILQYDIDEMLYNAISPFQHIQIAHSKTYGNMLILDGDPSKNPFAYTQTFFSKLYRFVISGRSCRIRSDLHWINNETRSGSLWGKGNSSFGRRRRRTASRAFEGESEASNHDWGRKIKISFVTRVQVPN